MGDQFELRTPLADRTGRFRNSALAGAAVALAAGATGASLNATERDFVKPQQLQQQQPKRTAIMDKYLHQTHPELPHVELLGTSTPKKDGKLTCLEPKESTAATTTTTKESKDRDKDRELRKWQETWRSIMPSQHIYFDYAQNDYDKQKAQLCLESLGAKIESFFHGNVTIIVSKRPYDSKVKYPAGDIFNQVHIRSLKVWSIEKVFRFMKHLDAEIPEVVSKVDNNHGQLENLLQNERIFGTNDKDPLAKRDDMKYFNGPHLYVYDLNQRYRPVVVKEWKDTKEITKINRSTNGKSIFIEEIKSNTNSNLVKRHKRRLLNLDDCTDYRLQLEAACYPSDFPALKRRSYQERCEFSLNYLKIYYSKKPLENPIIKYKGTGLENYFQNMIKKTLEVLDDNTEDELRTDEQMDDENDDHLLSKVLENKPDKIDQLNRSATTTKTNNTNTANSTNINPIVAAKRIDKLTFAQPPPQLKRENSIFHHTTTATTNNNNGKENNQQQLLCNYGEIVASGVTQSAGSNVLNQVSQPGNGLGPSKSSVINRNVIQNSQRTVMMNITPIPKPSIAKVQSNTIVMVQGDTTIPNDTDFTSGEFNNTLPQQQKKRLFVQRTCNKFLVTIKLNQKKSSTERKTSPFVALKDKIEKEDIKNLYKNQSQQQQQTRNEKQKKDTKPGYCENCRVKYADFDDHCFSDIHRSFAKNDKNFVEIDRLIRSVKLRMI